MSRPHPETSPVVTGRFNSQHPRKIIRGVGGWRGGEGLRGTTHSQVTSISFRALSLIMTQVAGTSHSTSQSGTTHTDEPTWRKLLGEEISKTGPAKPPFPCVGSCPSQEHPTAGMPRSPFPAAVRDTHSPSLCSGSLRPPRRGQGPRGLGAQTQLFGALALS